MYIDNKLLKEISDIASELPLVRILFLHQFALFLKNNPLPMEEVLEENMSDELEWENSFDQIDANRLKVLLDTVKKEMDKGKTLPMFDEDGNFTEHSVG